jgi:hypothetical protein
MQKQRKRVRNVDDEALRKRTNSEKIVDPWENVMTTRIDSIYNSRKKQEEVVRISIV